MSGKSTDYMDGDSEPMHIDQFETVVGYVKFDNDALLKACRAVLVDQVRVIDAAREHGLSQENLSRKVSQMRSKWLSLCEESGLEVSSVAVPPPVMRLIEGIQEYFLEDLKRKKLDEGSDQE